MATLYWIGSTGSQSLVASANWATSIGGAGGNTPALGDELNILSGSSDIDSGLASWAGAGTIRVGPQFTGTIGTVGGTAADTVGSTLLYYSGGAYGNFTGAKALYVNAPNSICNISNIDYSAGGSIILISAGKVNFAADAIKMGTGGVSYFRITGGGVSIASAATAVVAAEVWGGAKVESARNLTLGALHGGSRWTQTGTSTVAAVSCDSGAVYCHQSSGTITAITVFPGGKTSTTGASAPFTITNGYTLGPGSLVFPNPEVKITYTNPTIDYGFI